MDEELRKLLKERVVDDSTICRMEEEKVSTIER